MDGQEGDDAGLRARIDAAVAEVVAKQREVQRDVDRLKGALWP